MFEVKFTVGDPDLDFFKQNPHWRYLDSSAYLLGNYPEELCSKLRWAAFMIQDPDSKYFRKLKGERVRLVQENYLLDDFELNYDSDLMKVVNEDLGGLFSKYAVETMSKIKKDYYEREFSYQLLVQQERALSGSTAAGVKAKADIQVKLGKIYEELTKAREAMDSEKQEAKIKAQGVQQPGTLFRK